MTTFHEFMHAIGSLIPSSVGYSSGFSMDDIATLATVSHCIAGAFLLAGVLMLVSKIRTNA
jgi:nitrate reductase gamma subunit